MTLYTGRVAGIEPSGLVRVIVPDLAQQESIGPISTAVPDLDVGELIAVSSLGQARSSQLLVVARMIGRPPTVDEVPTLRGALDDLYARDAAQSGRLTDVEGRAGALESRATAIEGVNTTQNNRLTATETVANAAAPKASTTGLVTTKGDLLAGTAAGTLGRLAAPANGLALVADSAQATGWAGRDVLGMPKALTGAVAPTRYVGATATAGAPTTGTFAVGDFIIDGAQHVWVCSVAGTPGTWVSRTAANAAALDNLRLQMFGDATRTAVPRCQVFNGAQWTYTAAQASSQVDVFAQGGWTLGYQSDTGMWFPSGTDGPYSYIKILVPGRYIVHYRCLISNIEESAMVAVKITKNATSVGTSGIATGPGQGYFNTGEGAMLDAYAEVVLAAGDKIYWANWANRQHNVLASTLGNIRTAVEVRFVAPA